MARLLNGINSTLRKDLKSDNSSGEFFDATITTDFFSAFKNKIKNTYQYELPVL